MELLRTRCSRKHICCNKDLFGAPICRVFLAPTKNAPKFGSPVTKQGPPRALVLFCPNRFLLMLATSSDAPIASWSYQSWRGITLAVPGNPCGSRNTFMNFRDTKTPLISLDDWECGLTVVSDAPDEGYWLRRREDRVLGMGCRFRNHRLTIRLNQPRTTARNSTNIAGAESFCRRIGFTPYFDREIPLLVPSIGTSRRTNALQCGDACTRAIRHQPGLSRAMIAKPPRSHRL